MEMSRPGASAVTVLHMHGADWEDADPKTFTGRARIMRMGGAGSDPAVKLYRVAFEPGARTHWHVHSGAQLLVVVEGRCLVQRWDGPVERALPGDVVHIAPGEKHWHGAGPGAPATHLAINLDAETTWLEAAPPATEG
jgi:quercetin dioxygenase-like cupin family protein